MAIIESTLSANGDAFRANRDGMLAQLRVAAGEPLPLTQQQIRFDGPAIEVRMCAEDAGETAAIHLDGALMWLHYCGVPIRVEDKSHAASAKQSDAAGEGKLRASMNGRLVADLVAVGDAVQAGQPMVALEAMKKEHIHAAPAAGRVTAVHVKNGDQVAASRVVAELELGGGTA